MSIALQEAPMPVSAPPPPEASAQHSAIPTSDRLYRLSVDQYLAMAEAGILEESNRYHLIDGLLVYKMTKYAPHDIATDLLGRFLFRAVPEGWFASMQNPILIREAGSMPEPDGKIVRGDPQDYPQDRRVSSADVGLVVEVADSSVREDQTVIKALYALGAIPHYWIVNIPANRLEVYSNPTGPNPSPDYHNRQDLGPDDTAILILDGQEVARIAVRNLLPRI